MMRVAILTVAAALTLGSGCAGISKEEQEQLLSRVKEVENRQATVEDQAETRRQRLEERFADLEQAVSELRSASDNEQLAARLAAVEKSLGKLNNQPAATGTGSTTKQAGKKKPGELEKAKALLAEGKAAEAREILQRLDQAQLPKETAALITLLVGESYYQEKNYHEAILAFHKVVEATPTTAETPQAMLREAQSFAQLGKQENAAFLFRKLLSDYPDSEQADEVRKELDQVE